jgi:hypothetical protein
VEVVRGERAGWVVVDAREPCGGVPIQNGASPMPAREDVLTLHWVSSTTEVTGLLAGDVGSPWAQARSERSVRSCLESLDEDRRGDAPGRSRPGVRRRFAPLLPSSSSTSPSVPFHGGSFNARRAAAGATVMPATRAVVRPLAGLHFRALQPHANGAHSQGLLGPRKHRHLSREPFVSRTVSTPRPWRHRTCSPGSGHRHGPVSPRRAP